MKSKFLFAAAERRHRCGTGIEWVNEGRRGRRKKGTYNWWRLYTPSQPSDLSCKAPTLVGIEWFFVATAQSAATRRRHLVGGYSPNALIRYLSLGTNIERRRAVDMAVGAGGQTFRRVEDMGMYDVADR
jgi:hypothetical protein